MYVYTLPLMYVSINTSMHRYVYTYVLPLSVTHLQSSITSCGPTLAGSRGPAFRPPVRRSIGSRTAYLDPKSMAQSYYKMPKRPFVYVLLKSRWSVHGCCIWNRKHGLGVLGPLGYSRLLNGWNLDVGWFRRRSCSTFPASTANPASAATQLCPWW